MVFAIKHLHLIAKYLFLLVTFAMEEKLNYEFDKILKKYILQGTKNI